MTGITQDDVKSIFDYDPETGICTWKVNRLKAGPGEPIDERYVYRDGYLVISAKGKAHMLHRLIYLWMTGEHPKQQIDHINGDKLDNRWENLRDVSQYDNVCNRRRQAPKKNGCPMGVTRAVVYDKELTPEVLSSNGLTAEAVYTAQITIEGKTLHLGKFKTKKEAEIAYLQAKVLFHGRLPDNVQ